MGKRIKHGLLTLQRLHDLPDLDPNSAAFRAERPRLGEAMPCAPWATMTSSSASSYGTPGARNGVTRAAWKAKRVNEWAKKEREWLSLKTAS